MRVRELGLSGRYDPRRTWGGSVVSIVDSLHVRVRDALTGVVVEVHTNRIEPFGTAARRSQRADA